MLRPRLAHLQRVVGLALDDPFLLRLPLEEGLLHRPGRELLARRAVEGALAVHLLNVAEEKFMEFLLGKKPAMLTHLPSMLKTCVTAITMLKGPSWACARVRLVLLVRKSGRKCWFIVSQIED